MIKNTELLKGLSPKQSQAILLLLQGKSVEETANEVKVHFNTIYKWLENDTEFRDALDAMRESVFIEALQALQSLAKKAVETLGELLDKNHSDYVRLASAKSILENAIKVKEIIDLEGRIEKLEKTLEVKNE